jgi:hypothetical protein|tara:strand:+ start:2101 stop:2358 length:258 start_codon:yes stop_codon:yes gene_type:complete
MKTIKATKLREVLSSKGVDEGFIDRIFHRIQKAKTDTKLKQIEKDIERSKQKVKDITSAQEKLLIQQYGSKDKIPQVMKKQFGIE